MLWKTTLYDCCVLMLVCALSSCATTGTESRAALTVGQVIASAELYDGKVITVQGWASVHYEDYGIWVSRSDYETRNERNCISLLNHYKNADLNQAVDRKAVLVSGIFDKDIFHDKDRHDVIRLGACSKFGIRFLDPAGLQSLE